MDRYDRNIGAISESEQQILKEKTVLVAGLGGLGGYSAAYLARLGVGRLILCDFDVFSESNLNRQLFCTEKNIGKSKADCAREFLAEINSETKTVAVREKLTAKNVDGLIAGCDAVVDALDNVEGRRLLEIACKRADIPYVYGAVSGWFGQVAVSGGDGLITAKLYVKKDEPSPQPVLSFAPAVVSGFQASETLKVLLDRPYEKNKLLAINLQNNEIVYLEL